MALRAGWKRAQLGKSPSVLAGSPSLLDEFRAELAGSLLASYGFSALGVKFHPSYLSIGKRLLRFGFPLILFPPHSFSSLQYIFKVQVLPTPTLPTSMFHDFRKRK